jgi:uncharacterized membrane protein YphA (DoxX/SURF4 family)
MTTAMWIYLGRAILATVLIVAGTVKLVDRNNFSRTLSDLGIPARFRFLQLFLSFAVPAVELVVGLTLICGFWATIINVMALGLMVLFTIVTSYALMRRLNVECRCFGALSSSQFSTTGLVRNIVLTFIAAGVCWGGLVYGLKYEALFIPTLLLLVGYVILGVVAAQAAITIEISRRM